MSPPTTKPHPADGGGSSAATDDVEGLAEEAQHDDDAALEREGEGEEEEEMEEEELDEEEVEGEGYESSSSASTTTSTLTWISWFCALPGHEYFCEVAEDFIEDDFNLTGLSALVPFYKEAMEMVLDVEAEEEAHRVPDVTIVESSAELLYGLIHQRFIITRQGLQSMYQKYDQAHFGTCPRVYCTSGKLVPCGRSDLPGVDTVKLYCPSCVDMYVPPSSRFLGVDGAFFGTTFPHLLFQTYPNALPFNPATTPAPTTPTSAADAREPTSAQTSLAKVYIPRIYGFKVSERARSGPRMQWLRMRPRTEAELDWKDDDVRLLENDAAGGSGGPGESGDLFGDDDPAKKGSDDDDDDSEEEEEEEDAGKGKMSMSGIVAAAPAITTTAAATTEDTRGRPVQEEPSLTNSRVYKPLPLKARTSLPSAPAPALPSPSPSSPPAPTTTAATKNLADVVRRDVAAALPKPPQPAHFAPPKVAAVPVPTV
ncbi:hypothetical protein RQP46_003809 [Phenoliferia psychrophenolica]